MPPKRLPLGTIPVRLVALATLLAGGCAPEAPPVSGGGGASPAEGRRGPAAGVLRIALFNVQELSMDKVMATDPAHPQVEAAATILRSLRPDILVLQEVDHVVDGSAPLDAVVAAFQSRHLEAGGEGEAPLRYPWRFVAPSNTGRLSGLDLDGDGVTADGSTRGTDAHGQDSWGYGRYPGQFSMAVLSRFPVDSAAARTFQTFRWKDLPGHHIPPGFFSPGAEEVIRLSSKSHWDVPVETPAGHLHLWVSHPTPPAFDGPEERNRRRNFDEIAFWVRYLDGDPALYDDEGVHGGWNGAPFLVAGDLNVDPAHDTYTFGGRTPLQGLLQHGAIQDTEAFTRSAAGGLDTATFLGGRRVDYLLADARLRVVGGGVFWPDPEEDPVGAALADAASDHRLVWVDVALPLPAAGTPTAPPSP
jgi:endonuclease/exonuclease/phosphatase family metal-dependent hydrolase